MPLFHKRNRAKSVASCAVSVIPATRRDTQRQNQTPFLVGDLYLVIVLDLLSVVTEGPRRRTNACRSPTDFPRE